MHGMDFACAMRRRLPDSKLVYYSAYRDKEYLKGAIHLQVDGYIEKPLDPEEITQLIASLVKSVKQNQAATNPNSVFFMVRPIKHWLTRMCLLYKNPLFPNLDHFFAKRSSTLYILF